MILTLKIIIKNHYFYILNVWQVNQVYLELISYQILQYIKSNVQQT